MSELLSNETQNTLENIEARASVRTLHRQDREVIKDELQLIRRQLGRYEGTNALEGFLVEFLQTAADGELPVAESEGDEYRPELERALQLDTLCECDFITCNVKNGRLPGQLHRHGTGRYRTQQSVADELDDYLREHPKAIVLREAKTVWDEWTGVLHGRISRLDSVLELAEQERAHQSWDRLDPIEI